MALLRLTFILKSSFLAIFFLYLSSIELNASMPEKEYISQLQIANELALKNKSLKSSRSQALSSTLIKRLFGRYYQVGDSWTVAVWKVDHGMMRMTSDPEQTKSKMGAGGIFHYEVTQVTTGLRPKVIIRVTQRQAGLFPIIDPQVNFLQLTMTDQLLQSDKLYSLGADENTLKRASPNGIHTEISAWEVYPLDVPEISFESKVKTRFPEIPSSIQSFLTQKNWQLNLKKTLQFATDDFFGRPLEILWEEGKPWPSYFKTCNGLAILIDGNQL
jgi:hypothetical protein